MPEVVIPYRPRALQKELHKAAKRWTVAVCHRRFGKTVWAINHMLRAACMNKARSPRYAYLSPLLKQSKQVAWDYCKHFARPIPGVEFNESELRVDLPNGARIMLLGADNPDALRGIYLDGVILDEYAQMAPRVFAEIIRPALADRKGWAAFIGTPAGQNHFFDLWKLASMDEEWLAVMLRASETGIIPPEELDAARQVMSREQYDQEFECSFTAAMVGAYYAEAMGRARDEKRIGNVPWEPQLECETWWDLGVNDATAIWVSQSVGKEVRLIDYYENSGHGLEHYVKWLSEKPYVYGMHHLPHDVRVRELGTGRSREEMLRGMGLRKLDIVPVLPVIDGIEACRMVLARCWFDAAKCQGGINALESYRREWDDKRQTWRDQPLHDWASNGADAFRQLGVGLRERIAQARVQIQAETDFNPFDYRARSMFAQTEAET